MLCGIYVLRNTVDGRVYVGSAVDVAKRWGGHKHMTRVDYDIERSVFMLFGRYACPCGEISGLCQMFYEGEGRLSPPVELQVERLKWALRDHVRKEGNEPNF